MVRFAPADPFDDETPAADPRGEAPVALPQAAVAPARRAEFLRRPTHCWNKYFRLGRVRRTSRPSAPKRRWRGFLRRRQSRFVGPILRLDPPFAGALRQRLALRAATACAALARHREDSSALRDAEHLSPRRGAPTSPAGRIHRLWRAVSPRAYAARRADAANRRRSCFGLTDATSFDGVADALRDSWPAPKHPLAAAAGAERRGDETVSRRAARRRRDFRAVAADLVLARRLGWDAPVPLLATAIAHPSLRRGAAGKRPRPGDPDWADAVAGAYAMAAQEAFALAGELSRRSQALLAVTAQIARQGRGSGRRTFAEDDAVSPARAAKLARLSDRAARRLFDRLIELGAVRELSGRPNFRLYGL